MKKCVLFPGQGAQDLQMLDSIREHKSFAEKYQIICDITKSLPLEEITKQNLSYLNSNSISSLLTVLVSSILFESYLAKNEQPDFVAGYSVGQWTALYASGSITSFAQLVEIIHSRATLMDECFTTEETGMIGVIGVKQQALENFCQEMRDEQYFIAISNYNCPGQYSLSGTKIALEIAMDRLLSLQPKKIVRLPVSGAWHCYLLNRAQQHFIEYIQDIQLANLQIPTIDNTSGNLLPSNINNHKKLLADHISSPVRWEQGIRNLLQNQCTLFIEIGYGKILTKFGFFIERKLASHQHFTI